MEIENDKTFSTTAQKSESKLFDDLLSKNLPFDDDDGHLLSKRKKKAILLQNSNVIVGLQ
ncbi:hypothetical protein DERP_009683 [Dermatophagoides pteronyssinus]|uniref:Uncharacterized protein n=1 Tax=Dermatophagoides pteronyssinus TaxID=6956 RepID=A0ABQ8JB18_DERPT|nr:hypothetical protein DERP_009683 [Dermatophagoides pteronyssinus]